MKLLIRLYPRAWRERYGAEFEELLRQEPVGIRGSVDIVIAALGAHLQEFVRDSASTFAALGRSTSELRAQNWVVGGFALIAALYSAFRHDWSVESGANLLTTLAVVGLALLCRVDEAIGRRARRALAMIAIAVMATPNFGPLFRDEVNPVLFAFLVVLPEHRWPAFEHLRYLQVCEVLFYFLAIETWGFCAVRGVPIVPAVLLGGIWLALGVQTRRKRLRLFAPGPLPAER
jgi:TRAP-type uncharacterized transport system fused permease subunit